MQNPTLTQITNQIATETLAVWWKLEQEGTSLCAPHLTRALTALTMVEADHCGTALIALLGKRARHLLPQQRHIAVCALGRLSDAPTHQRQVRLLLRQALKDRHPHVREAATEAIGQALLACDGEQGLIEDLVALLQTEAPAIRMTAARALVALLGRRHAPCAVWLRERLPSLMAADARTRYTLEIALASAGLRANGEALPFDPSPHADAAPGARGSLPSHCSPPAFSASPPPTGHDKFAPEQVLRLLETLQDPDRAQRQRAALKLAQAMSRNVRVYRHKNRWILRHLDHEAGQPLLPSVEADQRSAA